MEEEEEDVRSVEATMVTMTKLVLHAHLYPGTSNLAGGILLKWMDTVACLSAELHAHSPCVTASVDDLQLESDPQIGSVIFLTARVNRAFNTSMEVGVIVESDAPPRQGGARSHVCKVFFTFVEKRIDGIKRRLPAITPLTFNEKTEFYLASERRKHRLSYTKKMEYAEEGVFHSHAESHKSTREISPSESIFTSTELVLPPHANHHQNTFGGQIMEWIEQLAYIIARKVCSKEPLLVAIDEIHFKSSSSVSDRITLKGSVNYTWGSTLEIGVCVEAYKVGEERRHCNSAFLTYKCDSPVPRLRLSTLDDERRARKALLRRAIRYERRAIRAECKAYAQPWSPLNAPFHSASNISNLRNLYQLTEEWEYLATVGTADDENQIIVSSLEVDKSMCFRAETTFPFSARFIYTVIKDIKNKHQWDPNCESLEIINKMEDEDVLFKLKLKPSNGIVEGPSFRLLCSAREPDQNTGAYTVAFTSVLPGEQDEKTTAEVRASGFIIKPVHVKLARRMTLDMKTSFRRRNTSDSSLSNDEGRRSLERSLSLQSECSATRRISECSSSENEEEPRTFQSCLRSSLKRDCRLTESQSCIITYIIHTTDTLMPYIARDWAGFGVVGVSMVKSLNEYLLQTLTPS